jgi:hypothetical protein
MKPAQCVRSYLIYSHETNIVDNYYFKGELFDLFTFILNISGSK